MMDRRRFLGQAVLSSFAACMAPALTESAPAAVKMLPAAAAGTAHRASVIDFGADPTGVKDVTTAVAKAIASLTKDNARLVFPPGTYRFAPSSGTAMAFHGYSGLEIFGNGAALIFAGNTQPLTIEQSKNIEVHDLRLDWARPPFSQGTVVEASAQSFTIAIDPEFPLDDHNIDITKIEAFSEYDAKTGLPAANGLDAQGSVAAVRPSGPQLLQVELNRALPVRAGMRLVLRHRVGESDESDGWGSACLQLRACEQVLIESVTLYAGPGAGAVMQGCKVIQFDDFRVLPAPGSKRLMSLCGGAIQLADCAGAVSIKQSQFSGMGDDGVYIFQSFWKIGQRVDDKTVLVEGRPGRQGRSIPQWELPADGAILQLSDGATLTLLGEIATESAESTSSGARIRFNETLSPVIGPGALLCNALAQPRTTVEHCKFLGNRGRGIVMHGRGHILNNSFAGCSMPALLLAPDRQRMEGPTVQSMMVSDNTFESCNTAATPARRGTVTVDTARERTELVTPPAVVNSGVTLSRNAFRGGEGPAIYCAATSWLIVEENSFNNGDKRPADSPAGTAAGLLEAAIVLRRVDQAFLEKNQAKTQKSIVMIECTEKVQTSENILMTGIKS